MDQWPRIWHYDEQDIPIGQQIVEVFTPFILHLMDVGPARKTVSRHRDNLWQIGGELIRLRYQDPELAKLDVRQAIQHLVQYDGAPLIYPRIGESEQDSLDSTCRKLNKFIRDPEACQRPQVIAWRIRQCGRVMWRCQDWPQATRRARP